MASSKHSRLSNRPEKERATSALNEKERESLKDQRAAPAVVEPEGEPITSAD